MKQIFRVITLLLLVGEWALASAAVYVIRVPGQTLPVVITKDHLGYKDTYVDTRAWTLAEDRAHPAVVERLIHLGQASVLAHTVNTNGVPLETQLMAAVGFTTTPDARLADKAKTAMDAVKSKLN